MCFAYHTDLPHPYNKIGDGPEGPEIRTTADQLRSTIVHKYLERIELTEKAKTQGLELIKLPSQILAVRSYGKKLLIELERDIVLIFSFLMAGRIQFKPGAHTRLTLILASGRVSSRLKLLKTDLTLYYDDVCNFGHLVVLTQQQLPAYLAELGPDLLLAALTPETWLTSQEWSNIFRQPNLLKKQLSQLLMEQSLVAGIGNYLKAEILYYAGLAPTRLASTLTDEEWEKLRVLAHQVINLAYSYGGLTIENFISPNGEMGLYPKVVYKQNYDPDGYPVVKEKTKDGRTSYWVPARQR